MYDSIGRSIGHRVVVAGTLSLGALLTLAPLAAGERSQTSSVAARGGAEPKTSAARAARTISLQRERQLASDSKHGFTLNEQGPRRAR